VMFFDEMKRIGRRGMQNSIHAAPAYTIQDGF